MMSYRRRLHALSRDPATLTRAVLFTLGFFVLTAVGIGWGGSPEKNLRNWKELNGGGEDKAAGEEKVSELLKSEKVDRAALVRAIRKNARLARKETEFKFSSSSSSSSGGDDEDGNDEEEADEDSGEAPEKELPALLSKSSLPAAEQALFLTYDEALRSKKPEDSGAAVATLQAGRLNDSAALPLTMAGDVLRLGRDFPGALKLYEAAAVLPEGAEARRRALDLALIRDQPETVERLLALQGSREAVDSVRDDLPMRLAEYTRDAGALLGIALDHILEGMRHTGLLMLSLLSAAVWFISLHKACRIPPRDWWISLLGLLLGVASVAITLLFLLLQESRGGLAENGTMGNDFVFFLAGVGLREEGAKLLCFLPLLPLLRNRSAGLALVSASCVGLGFALEENLNYYRSGGPAESLGRFVTANFMHLGMTGLLGYSLFRFLRYPKNYGPAFLSTFIAMVALHGFYDFCLSGFSAEISNLPTFILVGLAWFYFQTIHSEQGGAAQALSAQAVFLLGSALLSGCLLNYLVAIIGWHLALITIWPAMLSIVLLNALFVRLLRDL